MVGISNALSDLISNKQNFKSKSKDSNKPLAENDYNIPQMHPRDIIMSNEMQRRKQEDCLRNQHDVKKEKIAVVK